MCNMHRSVNSVSDILFIMGCGATKESTSSAPGTQSAVQPAPAAPPAAPAAEPAAPAAPPAAPAAEPAAPAAQPAAPAADPAAPAAQPAAPAADHAAPAAQPAAPEQVAKPVTEAVAPLAEQKQEKTPSAPAAEGAPVKAKAPKAYSKKMQAEAASRAKRLDAYAKVKAKLPSDRSEQSVELRKDMFRQWDVNGNGKLSLAEIDKACREQLELENVTSNLEPILIRAYYATTEKVDDEDGFIEFKEFRLLFEFIGIFFELMFLFEELEVDNDRRISEAEFLKNEDKLKQYGIDFADARKTFVEMAGGEGQMILFEEFCDYCSRHKLRANAAA